jgi:hypothetical protein
LIWKLLVSGNGRWIEDENGQFVCGAVNLDLASLITKAPDLLAALKTIVNEDSRLIATDECITDMPDMIDVGRKLIAKIEGR